MPPGVRVFGLTFLGAFYKLLSFLIVVEVFLSRCEELGGGFHLLV